MVLLLFLLSLISNVFGNPPLGFYNKQPIYDLTKTIDGWNTASPETPSNVVNTLKYLMQTNNSLFHLEMEFKKSSFEILQKLSHAIETIEKQIFLHLPFQASPKVFVTFRYNSEWQRVTLTSYKYVRSITFEVASDNKLYTCGSQNFTHPDLYEHPLKNMSLDPNYWTRAEWGLTLEFSRIFSETPTRKDYIPIGLSINLMDVEMLENFACVAKAIRNTRVMEFKLPLILYSNYGGCYRSFEENMIYGIKDASKFFGNVNGTLFWEGYFMHPVFDVHRPLLTEPLSALQYYDSLLAVYLEVWSKKSHLHQIKVIQQPSFNQASVRERKNYEEFTKTTLEHPLSRHHQIIMFLPIHHKRNYSLCALRTTINKLLEDGYNTIGIGYDLLEEMVNAVNHSQLENLTCYITQPGQMTPPPRVNVILDPVSTQTTSISDVLDSIGEALYFRFIKKGIVMPLKDRQPLSETTYTLKDLDLVENFTRPNATFATQIHTIRNPNGTKITERWPENLVTLKEIRKQFSDENVPIYCIGHEERNFPIRPFTNNTEGATQIYNETAKNCFTSQMRNSSVRNIIWQLNINLKRMLGMDVYQFIQFDLHGLQRYFLARKKVLQFNSEFLIYLKLNIRDNCEGGGHPSCSETNKKLGSYLEPILNWALAYNFTIMLHSYTFKEYYCQYELWQHLEEENVKDLVFYIPRQFKTSTPVNEIKCIVSKENLDDSQLNLHHAYSGVTLSFSIKADQKKNTLTAEEVCVLLYFTLGQFSWVQIVISQTYPLEELTLIYEAIKNPSFPENLLANEIRGRVLTIDIPLVNSLEQNNLILETVTPILERFKGVNLQADVSLSSWKYTELETVKDTLIHIKSLWNNLTNVGLCLDCRSYALAMWEETKRNSSFQPYTSFLSEADFIICEDVLNVNRSNRPGRFFEKSLDGLLFYTSIFQMLFLKSPSIRYKMAFNLFDVVPEEFRIQDGFGYHYKARPNINKYTLENLHSISEYARITKMPVYLMPAFQPVEQHQLASWWIISNYTSLSDVSVYEDLRSKYLGAETWKPIIKSKFFYPPKISTWMLPTFISISILLFLTIFVVYFWARNRRRRLLSKAEVDEFFNGKENSDLDDHSNHNSSTFAERKFLTEYEINKSAIEILESEVLGSGQFGIVYKGLLEDQDTVAIKVPQRDCSKETFLGMLGEVKLFSYIGSHVNVVRFIGAYTNEIRKGTLYVVMEFCDGGSLLSHLEAMKCKNANLLLKELTRFAGEIALGMEYIASKNVIHGDLAARNVLLSCDCTCKISDFGLSRKLYEYEEYVKTTDEPLPWRWMAYESLRRSGFSTQSDVWSYAVTLWEIYTLGDVPYTGLNWSADFVDKLETGLRLNKPRLASNEIFETMQKCWEMEPDDRPNFTTLTQYFTNLSDEHLIQNMGLDSREEANVEVVGKLDQQIPVFSNNEDLKLLNKPIDKCTKAQQPLLLDYFQWNDFPMTSLNED